MKDSSVKGNLDSWPALVMRRISCAGKNDEGSNGRARPTSVGKAAGYVFSCSAIIYMIVLATSPSRRLGGA
jgi:hypothetical protein